MAFIGFDVYGTLVDPLGMDVPLRRHFGTVAERFAALWRERQVDLAFRRALMRRYVDFDAVTRQSLRTTAALLGVQLFPEAEGELLVAYRRLPAFADVQVGVAALVDEGHTCVAFSNGVERSLRELLAGAQLLPPLADVVSVDDVKTYKPDPAVYQYLVERGGRPASDTWLVSSNGWDVLGAKSAGLRTAWVRRVASTVWDGGDLGDPELVVTSVGELLGHLESG